MNSKKQKVELSFITEKVKGLINIVSYLVKDNEDIHLLINEDGWKLQKNNTAGTCFISCFVPSSSFSCYVGGGEFSISPQSLCLQLKRFQSSPAVKFVFSDEEIVMQSVGGNFISGTINCLVANDDEPLDILDLLENYEDPSVVHIPASSIKDAIGNLKPLKAECVTVSFNESKNIVFSTNFENVSATHASHASYEISIAEEEKVNMKDSPNTTFTIEYIEPICALKGDVKTYFQSEQPVFFIWNGNDGDTIHYAASPKTED